MGARNRLNLAELPNFKDKENNSSRSQKYQVTSKGKMRSNRLQIFSQKTRELGLQSCVEKEKPRILLPVMFKFTDNTVRENSTCELFLKKKKKIQQ